MKRLIIRNKECLERIAIVVLIFNITCFPVTNHAAQKDVTTKMPNFVLIVIDDLGYGDLGIYGNKIHQTPNIDRLAKEGIIFTDFHSNGPVCSPTRAALLTGQYQQRTGIEHAIGFTREEGMPLQIITIAEILVEKGYKSGVFGKWHLGHVELFGPNDQGFEQSVTSNNTPDYHTHISRTGEYDWFINQKVKKEHGYLTDLVTKHSIRFIRENKDQPFFLFVSHLAVHFPFQGPDDPPHRTEGKIWHETKYGPLPESQYRRAYKDMLEAVDESIGKIVSTLDELKLHDNTLIFITSDNGAYSWVGSNYPYRGQKGDLFEGGHRIPAIAYWPEKIIAGSISNALTMTMDIAPTLVSLAGNTELESLLFDGIDLSPVLFGGNGVSPRLLFWRFNNPYDNTKAYAIRDGAWKYIEKDGNKYLFNLDQDPTENNNMIDLYRSKAILMENEYQKWLKNIEN